MLNLSHYYHLDLYHNNNKYFIFIVALIYNNGIFTFRKQNLAVSDIMALLASKIKI
jgi:hypothetical protein